MNVTWTWLDPGICDCGICYIPYTPDTQFDKDKHPQCLKDVRVFTERYIKEIQMEKREKETLVRSLGDNLLVPRERVEGE